MGEDIKVKICTLNVRGIRNQQKRRKIYYWCKQNAFDIICLQETHFTKEIINAADKDWNADSYHSLSNSSYCKGVSILFKRGFNFKFKSSYQDKEGRMLLLNILVSDLDMSIVNIYAPTNLNERCDFLKYCKLWIHQNSFDNGSIIVTGDFNSIYNAKDRTSHIVDNSAQYLLQLMNYNDLIDSWNILNYPNLDFTWIDPADISHKSRIDYIFVTPFLQNNIKYCNIMAAPAPDHKGVVALIEKIHKQRGPSYWKLNTSILLEDRYCQGVRNIIISTTNQFSGRIQTQSLWELIKIKIREFSISYSTERSHKRKTNIKIAEQKLCKIDKEIDNISCINTKNNLIQERGNIKREIDSYYSEKSKGAYVRSRAKWIEEGERSTSYFLKLEKKHAKFNSIEKLTKDDGTVITSDEEILCEARGFYHNLYTSTDPDQTDINSFLDHLPNIPKLQDNDKMFCEGMITDNECLYAIKSLRINKSPGLDGLPIEFYRKFWNDIGQLLIKVYNESFVKGELPNSMNLAVLNLIFKKTDRTKLKNYRPLSVSTTDYKILAFILARRLQTVISRLISSDQTGYIKGRYIGTNIRQVLDLIDYAEQYQVGGILLFLDFEKAFDSLEWPFMIACLQKFGFGPEFIKWIQVLYKNPTITIKINGWLSEEVNLTRGIRQGCPVSALLFIMATEMLAIKIRTSNIRGIKMKTCHGGREFKISQYADDSLLFLSDEREIPKAVKIIDEYTKVSGQKLNMPKTEVLGIGIYKTLHYDNKYNMHWCKDSVRCLGIYIGHNEKVCRLKNWDNKLEEMQKLVDQWRTRDLTFYGKILVFKTLALSKLVFSAINTCIPSDIIGKVNKIMYNFIWNKTERIKRCTLIAPQINGGLNVTDIESFFESLQASWIHRLFGNGEPCSWKYVPTFYFSTIAPWDVLKFSNFTSIKQFPYITKIPLFYQHIILSYNKSKDPTPITTHADLINQPLFGNKFLMTKSPKKAVTLLFSNWINQNITHIHHLTFDNGKINIEFLYNKVVSHTNLHIESRKLMQALSPYKNLILNIRATDNVPVSPQIFSKSKLFYTNLTKKKYRNATLSKWSYLVQDFNAEIHIAQAFSNKCIKIKENKLAEFNYKLLHYILPCNKHLKLWGKKASDRCSLCGEVETIEHLIFNCHIIKQLWMKVQTCLDVDINICKVVLGEQNNDALNTLLSQIAFSIFKTWVIAENDNNLRTGNSITRLVKNDLSYKILVWEKLKENNLQDVFLTVSNNLI